MFCQYKNALGIPGKGLHTHVFGVAIMDVIMTIIGAGLLSYFFKWNFLLVVVLLFAIGIVLHRLFCVTTTIDKALFT
jgi:uncharacterized oligopeptide transporter (OPT) family protein